MISLLNTRKMFNHWLVSQSIYSEDIGEKTDALSSVWIVGCRSSLRNSRTYILQIARDCNSLHFWVEVLNEPIESNIVTVIFLDHHFTHFL